MLFGSLFEIIPIKKKLNQLLTNNKDYLNHVQLYQFYNENAKRYTFPNASFFLWKHENPIETCLPSYNCLPFKTVGIIGYFAILSIKGDFLIFIDFP